MLDRVLMMTDQLAEVGGAESHAIALARAMQQQGTAVTFVCSRADDGLADLDRHVIPGLFDVGGGSPVGHRRGLGALGELLRSFRPTVVHTHMLTTSSVGIGGLVREYSPLVVSAHNYVACTSGRLSFGPARDCPRAHGPLCLAHVLSRHCTDARNVVRAAKPYRRVSSAVDVLRGADETIAYSTAVEEHLRRNGIARVSRLPLWPPTTEVQDRLEIPAPEVGRILFVGRLVPDKGVEVLLSAMRTTDARLEVVGDGWLRADLERLVDRWGLRGRVELVGWQDAGATARAYSRASVVVVPSMWPEPFGQVGIEAMLAERPVVASRTGGIPEWLEHGRTGLLVPPGDAKALSTALSSLLSEPMTAQRMGAQGRRAVLERFSSERHLDELAGIYASAQARWLGPAA